MASTLVQFLPVASLRRQNLSQYSQGSVASFATQFNIDWAGSLPIGGVAVAIAAKAGAATVAEIVVAPGIPAIEVNPGDWIGVVGGVFTVFPASTLGRQVADGATNTNTNLTSATAAFSTTLDPGANIAGAGIPPGTTISSVTNSTTIVLSAAATATATSVPLTITRTTALYTPVVI